MVMTVGMMLGVVAMAGLGQSEDLSKQFVKWSVQSLKLPGEAGETFSTSVAIDGVDYTLVMEPSSLRSDRFQAIIVGADGVAQKFKAAPPKTYRGHVEGLPGSVVGGSLINGQLTVGIDLAADRGMVFIQPLSDFVEGADHSEHVVYFAHDVIISDDFKLGVEDVLGMGDSDVDEGDGDPGDAGGDKTAEIAFDTDFEFFQSRDSDSQQVIDDIENITAALNVIYQRDVGICYKITTIIVRDNSDGDPYTCGRDLLAQFQNEWNNNQGNVQRDLAQLLSGCDPSGGVIGGSFFGAVCNLGVAYSAVVTLFTDNFALRVALSAHHIGHNWNAFHCDGDSDCSIMCSGLGGCGRDITKFGSRSIRDITSFKNSRTCLDDGCDTGAGPTCGDIKRLKAKCKDNGKIRGKVLLFNENFDGRTVTIAIDGDEKEITINGKKAKFRSCCFGAGEHTVELTDPANCDRSKTVTCN